MATTPTNVPATQFTPVPTTTPGQPVTDILNLSPVKQGLVPNVAPAVDANAITATIRTAIADDKAASTPGHTAAPAPDNFHFTDLTVNVSGSVPGDVFTGSTPDIKAQFLDLTPDNLAITGLTPGLLMDSGSGNDILVASSGRNILSANSGFNTYAGGAGQETFLADASSASVVANVLNLGSGDDLAITGINIKDFAISFKDTAIGLEIDASPTAPDSKIAAAMVLQGYTANDLGSKLTLGVSTTTDNTSFLFVHGN